MSSTWEPLKDVPIERYRDLLHAALNGLRRGRPFDLERDAAEATDVVLTLRPAEANALIHAIALAFAFQRKFPDAMHAEEQRIAHDLLIRLSGALLERCPDLLAVVAAEVMHLDNAILSRDSWTLYGDRGWERRE